MLDPINCVIAGLAFVVSVLAYLFQRHSQRKQDAAHLQTVRLAALAALIEAYSACLEEDEVVIKDVKGRPESFDLFKSCVERQNKHRQLRRQCMNELQQLLENK